MSDIILVAGISAIIWLIWLWWVSQPVAKKKKNDESYPVGFISEKPKNKLRVELDSTPTRYLPTPTMYFKFEPDYKSLNELEDNVIKNPIAHLTTAELIDMLPDQPEIPDWLMADQPKPRLFETDKASKK